MASNDRLVVVENITYHAFFIILIINLQINFLNFWLRIITIKRKIFLLISITVMISILVFFLCKITSPCNNFFQTYLFIQYLQDLLHPSLTGSSFIGMYLISKLFQKGKTNQDANSGQPSTEMVENKRQIHLTETTTRSENCLETDKDSNQICIIETSNRGNTFLVTVDDGRQVNITKTLKTTEPDKDVAGDCIQVHITGKSNKGVPCVVTCDAENKVNCFSWIFGTLWFLLPFICSSVALLSQGNKEIINAVLIYRFSMIGFYLFFSEGMKRHVHLLTIHRCYERCRFFLFFLGWAYFRLECYVIGILTMNPDKDHLTIVIDGFITIVISIVLILWLYLQIIFIMKADINKGSFNICWSIESISIFLGIVNFGEWIFIASYTLPSINLYLVKHVYWYYNSCLYIIIENLVYLFVVLYYFISLKEFTGIRRKCLEHHLRSKNEKINTCINI